MKKNIFDPNFIDHTYMFPESEKKMITDQDLRSMIYEKNIFDPKLLLITHICFRKVKKKLNLNFSGTLRRTHDARDATRDACLHQ